MYDTGVSLRALTPTRRRFSCPMVSSFIPCWIQWRGSSASVVPELSFSRVKCILWEQRRDGTPVARSIDWVDHPIHHLSNRPPEQYIPPIQEPYQYIIFRASEVKDLSVDDAVQPPPRRAHEDPAILAVSLCFQPTFIYVVGARLFLMKTTTDVNE